MIVILHYILSMNALNNLYLHEVLDALQLTLNSIASFQFVILQLTCKSDKL